MKEWSEVNAVFSGARAVKCDAVKCLKSASVLGDLKISSS